MWVGKLGSAGAFRPDLLAQEKRRCTEIYGEVQVAERCLKVYPMKQPLGIVMSPMGIQRFHTSSSLL